MVIFPSNVSQSMNIFMVARVQLTLIVSENDISSICGFGHDLNLTAYTVELKWLKH